MNVITGITRIRNEALILEDTLRHYSQVCDQIILLDDASTDSSVDIALSFDRVTVIQERQWSFDRRAEETRHRAKLLSLVATPWALCFDADERLEGELPSLSDSVAGYRFKLFDGYMTPDCDSPYEGGALVDLPRKWGPERRDILMLFQTGQAHYHGLDKREPYVNGLVETYDVKVRHYGKCLSKEHWEETCDYYANYWPNPYKDKWAARRGKAIHTQSDFGKPLVNWSDL